MGKIGVNAGSCFLPCTKRTQCKKCAKHRVSREVEHLQNRCETVGR